MRFALFILSVILAAGSSTPALAKMYKWVDEKGQVHFGDRIPEKYLVKEHQELNHRGIVVKRNEAAKTSEQKMEDKRLEKERKKAALIKKKKKQRDRVLLDTYTTERDLFVARDSRLDAIDSQIQLANSIIADSTKKIKSMEWRITQIQTSNREVPLDLYQRMDNEKEQVALQNNVRKKYEKRRENIAAQFDDYIKRFKVLKTEQKAKRERLARERDF